MPSALHEAVRTLIRRKVEAAAPIEGAAGPLALLVESSLRWYEHEGRPVVVVMGPDGRPRTRDKAGHPVDVTLDDYIAELKQQHPNLFQADAAASPPPPDHEPATPVTRDPPSPAPPPFTPAASPPEPPRPPPAAPLVYETSGAGRVARLGLVVATLLLGVGLLGNLLLREESLPEPASTGAVSAPAEPAAAGPVAGPAEVVDGATLKIGDRTVRLSGLASPDPSSAGDLARYLAGRPVECDPLDGDRYRCTVEGRNLAEVILYNGGAKAGPDASADLKRAESRARAERLGVWRR